MDRLVRPNMKLSEEIDKLSNTMKVSTKYPFGMLYTKTLTQAAGMTTRLEKDIQKYLDKHANGQDCLITYPNIDGNGFSFAVIVSGIIENIFIRKYIKNYILKETGATSITEQEGSVKITYTVHVYV